MLRLFALIVSCLVFSSLLANWFSAMATILRIGRDNPFQEIVITIAAIGLTVLLARADYRILSTGRKLSIGEYSATVYAKQAAVAFISSFVSLLITFVLTMLVQWQYFDWPTLLGNLAEIAAISMLVAFFFCLIRTNRLRTLVLGGSSSAFAMAAAYIYLRFY